MKKDTVICEHCGAKTVRYSFSFNKGLAVFLKRLYDSGGPVKTDDLGLTYSQRTNSQKLRYWGLADPFITDATKHKRGWWKITKKGREFRDGKIRIPRVAFTVRGKVTGFEGPEITFREIYDGYKHHEDYAEEAKAQIARQENLL